VQLPEARVAATRARLQQRFPGAREAAPPPAMRRAQIEIAALLRGAPSDLGALALDMDGLPPFHRRVYESARTIAPGATLSYGELAARLGSPGAARAVGQALGRNPFAIVVPCHRVLAAGGKVGGFSANGGVTTKLRLLAIEGVREGARQTAPESARQAASEGARKTASEGARQAAPGGARKKLPAGGASALFSGQAAALGFDPGLAVEHLRAADPALARVIDAVGPFSMRLDRTSSLFMALAQAIVYQQLNGKAAAAIFGRVRALFPRAPEGPSALQILRASDEKLRAAGLSRSKLLSLRDLAQKTRDGQIPPLDAIHLMDDHEIIECLTTVRGIGRWTVEMLLMFRLGRPDVLPADDYGIRKAFATTFGKRALPERKALEKHGARWKPYRTVASWYLWRALELPKI
jgi:methylated-DNA-[protein]-cysteine S-methyltransferase